MPVGDFDPEDPESSDPSIGDGGGAAPQSGQSGGPQTASYSKQQNDAYVPWSSFVNANEGVSQREAGKLQGQVQGDVNSTQSQLGGLESADTASINSNYTKQPSAPKPIDPSTTSTQTLPDTPRSGTMPTKTAPSNGLSSDAIQNAPAGPGPKGHHPPPGGGPGSTGAPLVDATASALPPNPWGAFLPSSGPQPQGGVQGQLNSTVKANPSAATASNINIASRGSLNANADPSKAPQDLETSAGPDAWAKLMGTAGRAQGEANALGSQAGVQSLLQSNGPGNVDPNGVNSGFDAALINGQGGPGFRQLSQQYGGNQLQNQIVQGNQSGQDQWAKLSGDVNARNAAQPKMSTTPMLTPQSGTLAAQPFVPQAAAETNNGITSIGGTDSGSGIVDQAAQQAFANSGDVIRVAGGGSDTGLGNTGGFGGKNGAINVKLGADGQPDYSDWWGGATDTQVGDRGVGITGPEWFALANMTPEQRAAWWKQNHGG